MKHPGGWYLVFVHIQDRNQAKDQASRIRMKGEERTGRVPSFTKDVVCRLGCRGLIALYISVNGSKADDSKDV